MSQSTPLPRDRPTGCGEITAAMLDEGERAVLREVGGADLGGLFSARDLAASVYSAMYSQRSTVRG